MESPEGRGRARAAWEAYASRARPVLSPLARKVVAPIVLDLLGFWLAWQLQGGFEGLEKLGMSRAAIYRRIKAFREHFGAHPDEFEMPGVTIDVGEYRRTPNPYKATRRT